MGDPDFLTITLMSLFLPTGPMTVVLSFLDKQGLAKLAQTCNAGRRIVYRTSVWMSWKMKPSAQDLYFSPCDIPATARHIGEPTSLCFYEWANMRRQHPDGTLPRSIAFESDATKYYELLKAHWIKLGRPCAYIEHHKWKDVLKGRAYLNSLPQTEVMRIYYRVVDTEYSPNNSYYNWVHHCINWSRPAWWLPDPAVAIPSSDPLVLLSHHVKETERTRYARLYDLREQTLEHWRVSARALRRLGKSEFDANDRAYKKDPYSFIDGITLCLPEA